MANRKYLDLIAWSRMLKFFQWLLSIALSPPEGDLHRAWPVPHFVGLTRIRMKSDCDDRFQIIKQNLKLCFTEKSELQS
jgi:hypothetical protein